MKRKDNYKNNLKCAAAMTMLVVISLLTITMDSAKGRCVGVITILLIFALVAYGILLWIKGTRQYIDHRLKEIEKPDLSEKVKEE